MANPVAKAIDTALGDFPGIPTSHESNPSNQPEEFGDEHGEKMQALAWQSANSVKIVEALKPKIVDAHDVVLKVTGSTVCGSDMHLLHGAIIELKQGDILGHEFMGIVDQVGPSVKDVKPGDRVVASFNIGCGECYMCQQKLSSQCTRTSTASLQNAMYGNRTCGMFGYSHFTGGFGGGQAEYVRVPWGDANLLKLPDSVADENALYLSDILVTSYHQVVDSGVKKGDIVGIWGAGAIGVFAAQWSFLKGAERVIVIDRGWRLDYIKSKLPKVETLDFSQISDISAKINEMTGPGTKSDDKETKSRPPGLDVALECAAGEYAKGLLHKVELTLGLETDTSEIVNECIKSVRPFGTVSITGVYAGYTNHFNIGALMEKGVRFIGNGQAPVHKYWKEILNDYLIPGKFLPIDLIVTHRVPLEDVPEVYKSMSTLSEKDKIVKTFVTTKFSGQPSKGAPQLTRLG